MPRNRIVVVDDDATLCDTLVANLRRRHSVDGFTDAEKLLSEAFDTRPRSEHPDLVIVDLVLGGGGMQGLDLIKELVSRNISSEILAVSGNALPADLLRAMTLGASDWFAKPFIRFDDLMAKVQTMANTGRKRRLYRTSDRPELDVSRLRRPVFLSYADRDKNLANIINRYLEAQEIGVWYARTTLRTGDPWPERLAQGLKEATVFVALLTDNYFASQYCIEELTQFDGRAKAAPDPRPLFLPVTSDLSEATLKNPTLQNIRKTYQCRDISGNQFVDGLTELGLRIKNR